MGIRRDNQEQDDNDDNNNNKKQSPLTNEPNKISTYFTIDSMADLDKQNDDQQEQYITNEDNGNISLLSEQIYKQLTSLRQDDLDLIEQFTTLYDSLCHLRQTLSNPQTNSTTDISTIPILIDSPTSTRYLTKPRSDSEPNILSDRQRIITIIDDLQ